MTGNEQSARRLGKHGGARMTEAVKGGSRSRILVIDDDAALAEMLSIVLRNEGFEPIWCAHGDKAFGAYRDSKPDLVLLDLMLPGRDGVDVCRDIRAESGVPIVMLTAKSDTIDVVSGLEAGADDYVAKPFKAKELVARIRTRLRRSPGSEESDVETLRIGDLSISVEGHSGNLAVVPSQLTRSSLTCCLRWLEGPGRSSAVRCCSSRFGD